MEQDIKYDEEKISAIAHKDSSLDRLNLSFKKHISVSEFKTTHLLAYWFNDFANYHDNEKSFNPNTLKKFKRGDIIKANLGFNIGNELGGLHYCVVISKNDNYNSGTLNIVPLSSAKDGKTYNKNTCINLGDELYNSINTKLEKELDEVQKRLENLKSEKISDKSAEEIDSISKKVKYLNKTRIELSKMKHGSFALVHQTTTISKQRIFNTSTLSNIRLSSESLDLIDNYIIKLFTK